MTSTRSSIKPIADWTIGLISVSGVAAWPISRRHRNCWVWLRGHGQNVDHSTNREKHAYAHQKAQLTIGQGVGRGHVANFVRTSKLLELVSRLRSERESRQAIQHDMHTNTRKRDRRFDNRIDSRVARNHVANFVRTRKPLGGLRGLGRNVKSSGDGK